MKVPLGLTGFEQQTRLAHILTVVLGVGVFWLGYFGSITLIYGDITALASETSIHHQRIGGICGSILVWTYFAVAFTRGYGGPVLNAFVYPIAIVTLAPIIGRWSVFGPDPMGLFFRFFGFTVEPLITTLLAIIPGCGAFITIMMLWSASIDSQQRQEWERYHLPDEFYEEFVRTDRE